ncbi:ABC transporter permease [Streptomyces sp. NPDC001985]|uniref:ABC transporter permease n=1 Tax=Streptomyces sp. NPDC001985 TaxID=3154406 RepID=UPI00332BE35F
MAAHVLRRATAMAVVLLIVLTLVFFLMRMAPGSPAYLIVGADASPAEIAHVERELGLDQPLMVQYATELGRVLTGDLGESIFTGDTVSHELLLRLPITLELTLVSLLFWIPLALIAGRVAAARRDTPVDAAVRIIGNLSIAVPSFWLGALLVLLFGLYLPGVLPSSGWVGIAEDPLGHLRSLVLPAFVLGLGTFGVTANTLRVSMIESVRTDYVRFGRAMGLPERRINRSLAFRNSLLPTTAVVGQLVGVMLSGSVLIENLFNLPGMGRLLVDSIRRQDYPLAVGATLSLAVFFLLANLIVDILYAALNPRVRQKFAGA